jgi:hypothetical protein
MDSILHMVVSNLLTVKKLLIFNFLLYIYLYEPFWNLFLREKSNHLIYFNKYIKLLNTNAFNFKTLDIKIN